MFSGNEFKLIESRPGFVVLIYGMVYGTGRRVSGTWRAGNGNVNGY